MPSLNSTSNAAQTARAAHRGSNQGGLRQYDERVVLQAVRQHGTLAGAEIAMLTQLTPQTVSMITKRLANDGLLKRGAPQRGKVGQPSVPLSPDPGGAYAIGIKLGRHSVDKLLVDFGGQIRQRYALAYKHTDPVQLLAEIGQRLNDLKKQLTPAERQRVQGVGTAAPLSAGGWQQLLGLPKTVASLLNLERLYAAAGLPMAAAGDARALQGAWRVATRTWLDEAGPAIAHALHAAACLLDLGAVVIDGSFDLSLRGALIAATTEALPRYS